MDIDGQFMRALNANNRVMVEGILKDGFDPNKLMENYNPAVGDRAFHHTHDIQMVELLLKYGADPNLACLFYGENPVSYPIHKFKNDYCISKILLENGANPNQRIGPNQWPILHIIEGNPDIVELFLKYGVDINALDSNGFSVVDKSIKFNFPIFKIFIKYNPIISVDIKRINPAFYTIYKQHLLKKTKTKLFIAVVFLGIHKRAVITANHPLRKLARGEFSELD